MRLQSEMTFTVRGKEIGGPNLLICLPLLAEQKSELLDQAVELMQSGPDLLEWRIDNYGNTLDVQDCLQTLKELRAVIAEMPLILTCRIDTEGGFKKIDPGVRLKILQTLLRSGEVDIVDVELGNDSAFIAAVKYDVAQTGKKLILSYHNFKETPEEARIIDILVQARDLGADIAKVAVMPKKPKDVLTLLSASLKARTRYLKIPMITVSMGAEGRVSRLVGGLFGADITFAIGNVASAPGQIPIAALRQAMTVLYE